MRFPKRREQRALENANAMIRTLPETVHRAAFDAAMAAVEAYGAGPSPETLKPVH